MATQVDHSTAQHGVQPVAALGRHWVLVLLPVLLFVGGAVALGLKRPVRYTATANLSVGHVYVDNPAAIPTVIDATKSLATVYSRAIHAGPVVADTRRRLGAAAGSVSGTTSATQIPQSPLIKVTAESSSSRSAVILANTSADALATYVNRQVRDNGASSVLARRFRAAALEYRRSVQRSDRLARRFDLDPTATNRVARDRAAAVTDTALLRREALRASYESAVQGGTGAVGIDVFSRAAAAADDRVQVMQVLVFVGLVGGLAAGAALALLRARRVDRLRRR